MARGFRGRAREGRGGVLASVAPAFHEALAKAGIGPDKPLYTVLTTLHETAREAREIVGKGARGLSQEGERELIQRIADHSADATHKEVERLALRVGWKNALLMALSGLTLLGGGYLCGQLRQAEPGFLGQLAAANDVGAIERYCRAHTVQQDGGTVCQMPSVWVKRSE